MQRFCADQYEDTFSHCPDGLGPGRVTQIQEESLSRPGIFVTDCSPSRNGTLDSLNPWDQKKLEKRQEQICPADCSNSCSSGTGLSSADCNTLANSISSGSKRIVSCRWCVVNRLVRFSIHGRRVWDA